MSLILLPQTRVLTLVIGQPYEGGYYAGRFISAGQKYDLVVAPRAQGEGAYTYGPPSSIVDGSSEDSVRITDGWFNTNNVVYDENHAARVWARDTIINGFQDWYIPSRNELEMLYRVFKPTPSTIDPNNPDLWEYTPNDEDYVTDPSGQNARNGHNTTTMGDGSIYTPQSPDQSKVALFKSGGSEAFTPDLYWSSTAGYGDGASIWPWTGDFRTGVQSIGTGPFNELLVRLVRRIPVTA